MDILVTGSAGFIGFHLCKKLLEQGKSVIGIDNLNNYYDVKLKRARNKELNFYSKKVNTNFVFFEGDIANSGFINEIFMKYEPYYVVNLAAQAGVRYSIENPDAYIQSNIVGFNKLIEASKNNKVKHFIFASSSSVYGGNKKMPFKEDQNVDHPVSLYAATKRSNELIAHSYSHLFNLPCTGLRFFTVYGPWGRPDMALFLFTSAILNNKPIKIFNNGNMLRDFTYIDDIINGIIGVINNIATKDKSFDFINPNISTSWAPYRIFNIGNSSPIKLMDFINTIEECLDKKAIKQFEPMQPGDVEATSSDVKLLNAWSGFNPETSLKKGISNFVKWYRDYYKVNN